MNRESRRNNNIARPRDIRWYDPDKSPSTPDEAPGTYLIKHVEAADDGPKSIPQTISRTTFDTRDVDFIGDRVVELYVTAYIFLRVESILSSPDGGELVWKIGHPSHNSLSKFSFLEYYELLNQANHDDGSFTESSFTAQYCGWVPLEDGKLDYRLQETSEIAQGTVQKSDLALHGEKVI